MYANYTHHYINKINQLFLFIITQLKVKLSIAMSKEIIQQLIVIAILWIPLYFLPFASEESVTYELTSNNLSALSQQISQAKLNLANDIEKFFIQKNISHHISNFEYLVNESLYDSKRAYHYTIVNIPIPNYYEISNIIQNLRQSAKRLGQQFKMNPQFFLINFVPLAYSQLDENVRKQFHSVENNTNIILKQLRNLRWMDQCKFTQKMCSNYLIEIIQSLQDDQYVQQEGVYLIRQLNERNLKQILFDILGALPLAEYLYNIEIRDYSFVNEIYPKIIFLKYLIQAKKQVQYLNFTIHSQKYIHDKLEKQIFLLWESRIREIIKEGKANNYEKVSKLAIENIDMIHSENVGKYQLLPNDYFMGSYLPLLALCLYPTIRLIIFLKNNRK